MKKILLYLLIDSFTKDSDKSLELVKEISSNSKGRKFKLPKSVVKQKVIDIYEGLFDDNKEIEFEVVRPKTKKDELIESLNYLKSKETKSKQDKESIYTLEMVLKSM